MVTRHMIHHGLGVEQRRRVHLRGALRAGEGHGAIGGGVDQAPLRGQARQHGQGRGRREAAQRFGVQLAGQQMGVIALLLRERAGGIAVEGRPHFAGAFGQGRHDGGGGKQDVEHDDDLAVQALAVELFLLHQDVEFAHAASGGRSGG